MQVLYVRRLLFVFLQEVTEFPCFETFQCPELKLRYMYIKSKDKSKKISGVLDYHGLSCFLPFTTWTCSCAQQWQVAQLVTTRTEHVWASAGDGGRHSHVSEVKHDPEGKPCQALPWHRYLLHSFSYYFKYTVFIYGENDRWCFLASEVSQDYRFHTSPGKHLFTAIWEGKKT